MPTDLPPDVRATLRAHAGTECQCHLGREILGPLMAFKCEMCNRLEAAFALGQSTERARQQGPRDKLIAALKGLYARAKDELPDPEDVDELVYAAVVLTECADELEAAP